MLGKALPKRIMCPFVVLPHEHLDDKQYVLMASNDRLAFIEVLPVLILVVSIGAIIGWLATGSETALIVTLVSLVFSGIFYILEKTIKPTKFEIFDRESGMITIPRPFSKRIWISAPWEEWQGRIWLGASSVGVSNHHLMLTHTPSGRGWEMSSSTTGVDSLLSYWSFLVQYMDKTEPLPNVGELSKYGKTTEGLGSWEEYENNIKSGRLRDPWLEWQTELKVNPELDVFYEADTIDHNHA